MRLAQSTLAVAIAACGRIGFDVSGDAGGNATSSTATLVQQGISLRASGNSVTAQFLGSQRAGDLDVVVIGWKDTSATIVSVQDTASNVYVLVAGPTTATGITQAVYYAAGIAPADPGANAVTVTFSGPPTKPDLRLLEYSGLVTQDPVDAANSSSGDDASDPAVDVTTTVDDLVVGATTASNGCVAVGGGARVRVIDDIANSAQDLDAIAPGVYHTGCMSGGAQSWVVQTVAFSVAPGGQTSPFSIRQTGEDETGSGVAQLYGDQIAADTMLVFVIWNNATSTVTRVADTADDAFMAIPGFPATYNGGTLFAAYYAPSIAGSAASAASSVAVTFSGPGSLGFVGVYAVEVAGLDAIAPYDRSTYAVCMGTTGCASGSLAVAGAPELVVSPLMASGLPSEAVPATDYRLIYFNSSTSGMTTGSLLQYAVAATPGPYETSFMVNATANWLQTIFAFR